jgi:predicted TIM-barrel fold metal-dependent hydrolase
MQVIDAQIHIWETAPPPGRPWDPDPQLARGAMNPVSAAAAIASMDAVGVDAAVISLPPQYRVRLNDSVYRFDNSYAEEAALSYPGRFCSVARLDPGDPEVEDQLTKLSHGPGVVGLRLSILFPDQVELIQSGGYDRLFTAAERQGIPIMLLLQPHLEHASKIVRNHPDLRLIIDHLGLVQPNMLLEPGHEPFAQLPQVLALAAWRNVYVKLSGAVTLSKEPFPFADLWPHVHRLVEAFGPERLMWGSDFTRARGIRTYAESIDFIRYTNELSESDKNLILGESLTRILGWPRSGL